MGVLLILIGFVKQRRQNNVIITKVNKCAELDKPNVKF